VIYSPFISKNDNIVQYFIKLARYIDNFNELVGRATAWLVLAMVLLVCYDVMMRFVFLQGSVAMQELEWHLFAMVFLLGGAYTLKHDGHVRVDILSQSKWMSAKHQAWINIIGAVLFLIPFCILVISTSIDFVANSIRFSEGSPDPGGLPYRYLLKSVLPIAFTLLLLQGLSSIVHNAVIISNRDADKS